MSMQNIVAALAVCDIKSATTWYTKLLGRGPTEMLIPTVLEWEFPGGGWLRIYEKPERAGKGAVTITDDDLQARIASLQTAHIRIDKERSSGERDIAIVEDPDGNQIVFAMARE